MIYLSSLWSRHHTCDSESILKNLVSTCKRHFISESSLESPCGAIWATNSPSWSLFTSPAPRKFSIHSPRKCTVCGDGMLEHLRKGKASWPVDNGHIRAITVIHFLGPAASSVSEGYQGALGNHYGPSESVQKLSRKCTGVMTKL